ncbi:3,4-dihydroxy-2-butanone-4-phosphate synthase [Desulfosporosinus acididurans]
MRNGQGVLVTDDEHRENEGDLMFSAQFLTEAQGRVIQKLTSI